MKMDMTTNQNSFDLHHHWCVRYFSPWTHRIQNPVIPKNIASLWIFAEIEIKNKDKKTHISAERQAICFFVLETINATSWVSGNALSKSKGISCRFVWWSAFIFWILFPLFIWLWFTSVSIASSDLFHDNWERLLLFSSCSEDSKQGVT